MILPVTDRAPTDQIHQKDGLKRNYDPVATPLQMVESDVVIGAW